MKKTTMLLITILCTLLSCNDKYPDLKDGLYAEFKTDKGIMVLNYTTKMHLLRLLTLLL